MFRLIEAILTLSGMIIGAGMFAIPFSFARAGFWLGVVELVILSAVVLVSHLLYAQIVLKTKTQHRLPGYVEIYLGRGVSRLSRFSAIFGIGGSLLVYLILGSIFLENIFPLGDKIFWVLILALAGAVITFFPLRKEAFINGLLTLFLVGFITFLIVALFPKINPANLSGFVPTEAFLPYGILLFALSGGIVIPEVAILVNRNQRLTRWAVVIGTLLPALFYFLFAMVVVGVAGNTVGETAISSLLPIAGSKIVWVGNLIGFLAVFTSFVASSKNLQEMLRLDLFFPRHRSWLAVSFTPLLFYFLGLRDFVSVIGVVGAVAIGIDLGLVLSSFSRLKKRIGHKLSFGSRLGMAVIYVMVAVGIIYEVL